MGFPITPASSRRLAMVVVEAPWGISTVTVSPPFFPLISPRTQRSSPPQTSSTSSTITSRIIPQPLFFRFFFGICSAMDSFLHQTWGKISPFCQKSGSPDHKTICFGIFLHIGQDYCTLPVSKKQESFFFRKNLGENSRVFHKFSRQIPQCLWNLLLFSASPCKTASCPHAFWEAI